MKNNLYAFTLVSHNVSYLIKYNKNSMLYDTKRHDTIEWE